MFISKETDTEESGEKNYTPEMVLELIRPVQDPDLGISIVDMGLIYNIQIDLPKLVVEMTLTSPACPYGGQLISEVTYIINAIHGVEEGIVDLVWDPPWSMDLLSEEVKLDMGIDF